MQQRYEKFLSLLIAKQRLSSVVILQKKLLSEINSTSRWLYLNQQGALVKEMFRNSELLEFLSFGQVLAVMQC